MSKIISIHGYELHVHNGEPMVRDLELAEKLGYERPRRIRELIKVMLERSQIDPSLVCPRQRQTPGGGRPSLEYYLSEKAALKVITKSETLNADKITDQMIDVFIDARKGEPTQRHIDPVILQFKQATAIVKSTLQIGKLFGTDAAMCNAVAAKRVQSLVGVDVTPLLTNNSVADVPMTATALGALIGLSCVAMNKALEADGMQAKNATGGWTETDKAKEFCTNNPYQSKYSSRTGYQLLWFKSVLDEITAPETNDNIGG